MLRGLCLFLAIVLPGTCSALEIRRVVACSGVALQLRGDIKEGDYLRLKAHFKRKEKIVGFDLSSGGGILEEGLRIADLARRNKLAVYVADECDSVCAFVFFSAAKRYVAQQSKIGVHSISNSRDIEDPSSMLLTVKLARISARLGVSNSAIGKMVITRPTNIAYLDQADLSALEATTGNPFDCETGQRQQNAARDEKPLVK